MDAMAPRQWLCGTPCSWDAKSIPQLVLEHPTRQYPAVESEVLDIEVRDAFRNSGTGAGHILELGDGIQD